MLAGVNHITISPALLRELAATPVEGYKVKSIFDAEDGKDLGLLQFGQDESKWRMAFTRNSRGEGERKLSQVSCFWMGGWNWWLCRASLLTFDIVYLGY